MKTTTLDVGGMLSMLDYRGGPTKEGLHLVVNLLAQPADLALGDAAHPIALTRSSTERVETPWT